jgi:hypothetical protein
MITVIKKSMKTHEIEEIISKRKKEIESKNANKLKKHFGSLQRGLDGLDYQKEVRNEW